MMLIGTDSSPRLGNRQASSTCRLLAPRLTIAGMDHEVTALKRLIGDSVATRVEVADRLDYNEQTLYQIANGIKLKSGKPRAVGRALREALDKHYPGWLANSAGGKVVAASASTTVPADLAELLVDAVAAMPRARWTSVQAQLEQLAAHPEMRDDVLLELKALLAMSVSSARKAS